MAHVVITASFVALSLIADRTMVESLRFINGVIKSLFFRAARFTILEITIRLISKAGSHIL
jgi:hypothetical protein